MEEVLIAAVVLGLAVLPWLLKPVERAVPTDSVGWIREVLIFGFFIPIANLSDRFNSLSLKEEKLKKELTKVKKLREDESKRLEAGVTYINDRYRAHLHDYNGKRKWWYLWRKVPVPTLSFIAPVADSKRPSKNPYTGKQCTYSLQDLPPEMHGQKVKVWTYRDKRNQQMLDAQAQGNRKNKGGNNNQQQGNNQ